MPGKRRVRGGLEQQRYLQRDSLTLDGEHRCNIWHGEFLTNNTFQTGIGELALYEILVEICDDK